MVNYFEEFEKAINILGVFKGTTNKELKKRYLELSKIYHPDMQTGNEDKFREVNEAYKILKNYMENFAFELSEEEFYTQRPELKLKKQFNYF